VPKPIVDRDARSLPARIRLRTVDIDTPKILAAARVEIGGFGGPPGKGKNCVTPRTLPKSQARQKRDRAPQRVTAQVRVVLMHRRARVPD
jgi:hypothetical protein